VPIQKPGVIINQKIPQPSWPLYNCPKPGKTKLKTAAKPGFFITYLLLYKMFKD
jgi:hypothetical protein